MSNTNSKILEAAQSLAAAGAKISGSRLTIGFDGFVDQILHVVETRSTWKNYTRVNHLQSFANRISAAAGKSANIELVPLQEKMGGNGPLMSMAAVGMGTQVTCIGLMGFPILSPVFEPLHEKAELFSIGNPGSTDALEFVDGKIMLGKIHTIREMCWPRILEIIGFEKFKELILQADMVGCTNWTMLTEMGEILDQIMAMVPPKSETLFFFDLADPEKRSRQDLKRVLGQISTLGQKARCLLGLNLRESEQVCHVLGLTLEPKENTETLGLVSGQIADALKIHGVVIHSIRCSGATIQGKSAGLEGPFCASPKLSTGAGDHFNGGFVCGVLGGLDVQGALYCAIGTSGWYVRNGHSPSQGDVLSFLQKWGRGESLD